ncbi:DJ-1/PfpI family protein [bacterium]|nr:DJ-1/PfpI family protein [bacterium]
MALSIGFVLFPGVTQLDFTGPLQVLSAMPDTTCHIVAASLDPVETDTALRLIPTTTFATCPPLDVICVPGGGGVAAALVDGALIGFVKDRGEQAKWVTSVCTGAFILGRAGLLRNRRAATHWAYRDLLPLVGALPSVARVARDGNVVTGGGVTAGIDFALMLAGEIAGPGVAQGIQLGLEYDPSPPFDAGSPKFAPEPVRERLEARYVERRQRMQQAIESPPKL